MTTLGEIADRLEAEWYGSRKISDQTREPTAVILASKLADIAVLMAAAVPIEDHQTKTEGK